MPVIVIGIVLVIVLGIGMVIVIEIVIVSVMVGGAGPVFPEKGYFNRPFQALPL